MKKRLLTLTACIVLCLTACNRMPEGSIVDSARTGDKQTVIKFIKAGADVNQSYMSLTPLSWAVKNEDKEMLSILLKAGANTRDPIYTYAFDSISRKGNKEIINMLLEKNADPTDFLLGACVRKDQAFLTHLLELGADPNGTKRGWTCLMEASNRGDVAMVEELLKWKADPNLTNDLHKRTSLHLVLELRKDGAKEITKMLLNAGANPNVRDAGGVTPIISAVNDSAETIDDLIKAGADVNAADNLGWTTLMWAVNNQSKDIISLLLEAGANPTIVRPNGESALSIAEKNGYKDITEMLMKAAAKK